MCREEIIIFLMEETYKKKSIQHLDKEINTFPLKVLASALQSGAKRSRI